MEPAPQDPDRFGIGRLFWLTSEAIVGADLTTGTIVLWNPAAEALFGWSASTAIGMPLERLVPGALRAQHLDGVARYQVAGSAPVLVGTGPVDVPACRADGSELHVSLSLTDVSDLSGSDAAHRFVLALVRDMTAVWEAERQLHRSNEALREFVAAASHDLRTPLTSVLGFARTLQSMSASLSPSERAEALAAIVRGASTASRMVDDLLTLSQIQAGALESVTEVVAVASVARSAADQVGGGGLPGGAGPFEVEVSVADDVVVSCDPHHVERMLVNLLSNAARHGRPPVRVTATVLPGGESVEIRVWDSGDGVPVDFEARLFTSFAQADPGRREGTGLGLSIIRGLALANGGAAFYERADGGCCFGVRLPMPMAAVGGRGELVR